MTAVTAGSIAAAVVAIDAATKAWAERALAPHDSVPVLGDALRLTLGYNTGIAFGLLAGAGWPVLAGTLLGSAAIVAALVGSLRTARGGAAHRLDGRLPWQAWAPVLATALIAGGALANVADRAPDGRVTDFLDVGLGAARWPAFNVADAALTLGACALVLLKWGETRAGD